VEKMLAVEPGTQEFDRRAREGNLVPVSCEVIADLETPISAYLRLRDLPHPFLLESVEGGAKVARYSFLGAEPQLLLKAFPSHVEITEAGVSRRVAEDPLVAARGVLGRYRPVADPTLPRFYGSDQTYRAPSAPTGRRSRPSHLQPRARRHRDDLRPPPPPHPHRGERLC